MSRASNALGYFGERVVLADLNRRAAERGWGIAVPLAPAYPADILDLRPSGPVFVEVKTTRTTNRVPALSVPEAAFARRAREEGYRMELCLVRVRTILPPAYSLSYSPIPRIHLPLSARALRAAGMRLRAPAGPQPAPTSALGSALGTALRSGGTAVGSSVEATGGPSWVPPAYVSGDQNGEGAQYNPDTEAPDSRVEREECRG